VVSEDRSHVSAGARDIQGRTYRACVSRTSLQAFVIALRSRGLSPGGINVRLRTINSFLTWLHSEGHLNERLRIKLLPSPPTPYARLADADIRRLVRYVPGRRGELRAWALAMLLLDTGLRIAEALSQEREHVDLDALAIRVIGTGQGLGWCRYR
jgi:site-specific recombinase XerC